MSPVTITTCRPTSPPGRLLDIGSPHYRDIDLALHVRRLSRVAVLDIPLGGGSADEATGGERVLMDCTVATADVRGAWPTTELR
jgi:hypothetical protein